MGTLRWCATLVACGFLASTAQAGDLLAVLKTKTETYENVTLISRTATHLFVQHSRGVANVKIAEVGGEALRSLGLGTNGLPATTALATTAAAAGSSNEAASADSPKEAMNFSIPAAWKQQLPADFRLPPVSRNVLLAVLGGFAVAYLFFCYCAALICQKTGAEPGILIWLPVLQLFPLLRAARMPAWWFLLWLVPGIQLIAQIVWSVKIAAARGKGMFTSIMLILPVTGLFAFLYLAFSGGSAPESDSGPRSFQTEPLPA